MVYGEACDGASHTVSVDVCDALRMHKVGNRSSDFAAFFVGRHPVYVEEQNNRKDFRGRYSQTSHLVIEMAYCS